MIDLCIEACLATLAWAHAGWYSLQWRHMRVMTSHITDMIWFNNLFWLTYQKTSKVCIADALYGEPISDQWFPLQRVSNMGSISLEWCHNCQGRERGIGKISGKKCQLLYNVLVNIAKVKFQDRNNRVSIACISNHIPQNVLCNF